MAEKADNDIVSDKYSHKKVEYLDTQFVQTAFAENILLCPSAAEQFPITQKVEYLENQSERTTP